MNKKNIIFFLLLAVLPVNLQAREFLNTVFHLNFGGMYTFATAGDIIDNEEKSINSTFTDSKKTSHYETAYSFTMDVVPMSPIILGMESHAIKLGLRGAYRFHYLQQRVKSGEEYGGRVMDYQSWMVGPVIHYAPIIGASDLDYEYTATGGFTLYALAGKLNGDLSAAPAVRDFGGTFEPNSTSFDGYKFDIGVGAEIALCTLNLGTNLYYSYAKFNLDRRIYADMGRDGSLREVCLELYVGLPFESFIKPFIPRF